MLELIFSAALVFSPAPPLADEQNGPEISAARSSDYNTGEPVRLEDLPVVARQREAMIRDFVNNVADPVRDRNLARWKTQICVGVANMQTDAAEYIADRISTVASDLGLRVGRPGCKTNVHIIATDVPKDTARSFVERYHRAIRPNISGASQGRAALQHFQETDSPIRWWHISQVTGPNGDRAYRDRRIDGDIGTLSYAPAVRVMASRLLTSYSDDLLQSYVIIDPSRLSHLSIVQLADYLSVISLAQINPQADTQSYDTILNVLHDDKFAAPYMTEWDTAYLQGLYGAVRSQEIQGAASREIQASIARASDRMRETGEL